MSEAFQPTFEYLFETVSPGVPDGTRIAEISRRPPCAPVSAVTVTSEVMSVPALVMNALVPLTTHSVPSPDSTAVVRVAPASEPPPGSVNPNAASRVPAHSSGSHSRFCSSDPNR